MNYMQSMLFKIYDHSLICLCIYKLYVFPKQSYPKQVPFDLSLNIKPNLDSGCAVLKCFCELKFLAGFIQVIR